LFLFILMLIDIRISELQNNNNNSLLLAIIITIIFSYNIFQILPYSIAVLNNYFVNINHIIYNLSFNNIKFFSINNTKNNEIFFTNSNDWNGNLIDTNHISNIGNILYTNYNLWLIITSFILLLAMTGAIIITIKQK
jgi:NADH-ubiquinone oxidoreductase chain 6